MSTTNNYSTAQIYFIGILLLFTAINQSSGCLLCILRLPPRPRPIDHFLLPSLENSIFPESITALCNGTKSLQVSYSCGRQIIRIICSIADFIDAETTSCSITDPYEQCKNCFQRKTATIEENFWAVTWLDSLGKMPSAISEGNYFWFGDYEQCVSLKESGAFHGRYCQVFVEIPDATIFPKCLQEDPLEIRLGFCSPVECTANELNSFLQSHSEYKLKVLCEVLPNWHKTTIVVVCVLVWITFIGAGTALEASDRKWINNEHLQNIARCISIRVNGGRCLSTKRFHNYHSIQGVQVLATAFVVTASCYLIMMPYIENVIFSYEMVKLSLLHPLNNFSFHIDGFIAVNSLFWSLLLKNRLKKAIDIKIWCAKGLLQVLPSYVVIIFFIKYVFETLSSGPLWNHTELVNRCYNNWWKNLLFINNFFDATETCVDGGYLLSLHVQYFLLLTILLFAAKYNRTAVIAISVVGIVVSGFYTLWILMDGGSMIPTILLTANPLSKPVIMLHNAVVSPFCRHQQITGFLNSVFIRPWTRISGLLIGFLYSFLFTTTTKLSQVLSIGVRLSLLGIGLFIAYATYPYTVQSTPSTTLFYCIYAAVHRTLFAALICTLIYLCYRNSAGELTKFLEWRLFNPISKQCIIVLLVSEPVFIYMFTSLHRPFYATHWSTLYMALGTLVLSCIIAFALDIFITRPIRNIVWYEFGMPIYQLKSPMIPLNPESSLKIPEDYIQLGTKYG